MGRFLKSGEKIRVPSHIFGSAHIFVIGDAPAFAVLRNDRDFRDFGLSGLRPIFIGRTQAQGGTHAHERHTRHANLLATHAQSIKTPQTPWKVASGIYASAPVWLAAQAHFLDGLEQLPNLNCARVFSREMVRTLRKHPALLKEAGDSRKRVERHAQMMVHHNTDPELKTLHHSSEALVTGTRQELAKATGISYDRVRALLTGYRQYSNGWARTPERARIGPAKPGRPKKPIPVQQAAPEPEFFQAGEASFF